MITESAFGILTAHAIVLELAAVDRLGDGVDAPIVEELTFRGLGMSLLLPYGRRTAILATGVLFGVVHGLLIALPLLIVFGVAVGWVRDRTQSVYPGMVLHGTFNGGALLASVLVTH